MPSKGIQKIVQDDPDLMEVDGEANKAHPKKTTKKTGEKGKGKKKRAIIESDELAESGEENDVEDDGEVEATTKARKSTKGTGAPARPATKKPAFFMPLPTAVRNSTDPQSGPYGQWWPLDMTGTRRLTLHEFNGTLGVDLREYQWYDGELKPGKKGLFMTLEEWRKVCSLQEEIMSRLNTSPPVASTSK